MRTIYIDYDSTLVNFSEVYLKKVNKKFNMNLTLNELDTFKKEINRNPLEEEKQKILKELYTVGNMYEDVKFFDGAIELLQKLKKDGFKIKIITTNASSDQKKYKELHIKKHLSDIIDFDNDVINSNKKQIHTVNSLFIDDSFKNILSHVQNPLNNKLGILCNFENKQLTENELKEIEFNNNNYDKKIIFVNNFKKLYDVILENANLKMNDKEVILSSSNKSKINEFKEILPNLKTVVGKDIREVKGTMDDVIIYKTLEANKNEMVDDTILIVNGKEVVDIKWNIEKLKEGDKAIWVTSLGYNDGKKITVYRGEVEGTITKNRGDEGFAFDPYFIPKGSDFTLGELNKDNLKKFYSARTIALLNFKNNKAYKVLDINSIPKWKGKYQNEEEIKHIKPKEVKKTVSVEPTF